jgi:hypothetical protein
MVQSMGSTSEGHTDSISAADLYLPQAGRTLEPAKRMFDEFAEDLARSIAGVSCGSPVNRTSPFGRVLVSPNVENRPAPNV